ncbi:hypothetical protein IAT38_001313 [Cryptococcus sp. DSM 104549]
MRCVLHNRKDSPTAATGATPLVDSGNEGDTSSTNKTATSGQTTSSEAVVKSRERAVDPCTGGEQTKGVNVECGVAGGDGGSGISGEHGQAFANLVELDTGAYHDKKVQPNEANNFAERAAKSDVTTAEIETGKTPPPQER